MLRSVWQSYWLHQNWSKSDDAFHQLEQSLVELNARFDDFLLQLEASEWDTSQINLKVPKEILVQEHHTLWSECIQFKKGDLKILLITTEHRVAPHANKNWLMRGLKIQVPPREFHCFALFHPISPYFAEVSGPFLPLICFSVLWSWVPTSRRP